MFSYVLYYVYSVYRGRQMSLTEKLTAANNEAAHKNGIIKHDKDTIRCTEEKPKGAKWFVFGAWHKIGEFSKVFLHNGSEWVVSSKNIDQLMREFKNQEKV